MSEIMLSSFPQQTTSNTFNSTLVSHAQPPSIDRLSVSYDLNNYQTLLTHLQTSDDPRWILFIAPPGKPNFQFLQQAGIDKSRVITLHQKQISDADKLFKDALCSNNYAAVIRWVNECNNSLVDEINQLTKPSNTHCFIYCAQ